jgi:hypothetical protein
MPIAAISLVKASLEGFEFDDEILTVFERFEVVWPGDIAETITGRSSSDELIERGEPPSG